MKEPSRVQKQLKMTLEEMLKDLLAVCNRVDRRKTVRYNARSGAERTNARLKDEFGGRTVQVKGRAKVYCHLMFGVLVLTADQLMRLMT